MDQNTEYNSFIDDIIQQDLSSGRHQKIHTRFPPEPNGYMHIGHCKAFSISFLMARKYGGLANLRFDDTNPAKEETEYVDSIMEDIRWLGFDWNGGLFYASDCFGEMYEFAVELIEKGKAFVCDLTPAEMRAYRGTLKEPGRNSPYRDRSVEENLRLFNGMKNGEFDEGIHTLRAKIDMASPNINMRDPVIYRVLKTAHHRTGDKWCIYPMYDYAHPIEDALEGITHSLCSLEFEDHRPFYDWVLRELAGHFPNPPRQIEFARLNITRTPMSKRFLRKLVEESVVDGWDDPRMPTLAGMRRRGYTPEAINDFISRVGVAKANSVVDGALLEHCVREHLIGIAPRMMAVLSPLKVVLTNWPEGHLEELEIEAHPEHPEWGTRKVLFGRELYIEQEDFMEDAPKKFFRLAPEREVRLKSAYIIKCEEVVKDENGNITELRCTADMTSRSGEAGSARKVKGTLHWVEASSAETATVKVFDYLLKDTADSEAISDEADAVGDASGETAVRYDVLKDANLDSLKIYPDCKIERALSSAKPGERFQFIRQGFYCVDRTSEEGKMVFNLTVPLKDTWQKIANKE